MVTALLTACSPSGGAETEQSPQAEAESQTGQSGPLCSPDPVPRVRPKVRAVAFPRGRGPVYVGLGTGGVVHYMADAREDDGWYYNKSLWAVAPTYRGLVTITGRQVDGVQSLRFNAGAGFPGQKVSELHFPAEPGEGWLFGPSDTLFRAPGCYAFDVRGNGFRYVITFRAEP
jgi:hypothetical protein